MEDVIRKLKIMYPNAKCELEHNSIFELLIAVILSAQCTDKRVNIITKELFNTYNTPEKILNLGKESLEKIIKSCGLYKAKAKNIIDTCEILVRDYNSNVPNSIDELLKLPGVGRKTASVVLAVGFGIPALPVDTHVFRVSNRIGLVNANTPKDTEKYLKDMVNPEEWILLHHLLIFHGRYTCTAKKPKCDLCILKNECKFLV